MLADVLDRLRTEPRWSSCIAAWQTIPARESITRPFPADLHPALVAALRSAGIEQLFSHQHEAFQSVQQGKHTVVVTPTASGKTLCYNLPVLNALLHEKAGRAMYLFPTKALAQDQLSVLQQLIDDADATIATHTYDGDTPAAERRRIRQAADIVITNPDMLHAGILPHHTRWHELFSQLRFVVMDEMHGYRGVFGSHVANVIRRLRRICNHYGSEPIFILASATIANPAELAEQLIDEDVHLIDENGAPSGQKEFVFYNPPVVNQALGIRRSVVLEASGLAVELLRSNVDTIVFARTRMTTEVMLTYLRQQLPGSLAESGAIRGYRGGYLPQQRREIEQGLRRGDIKGVVSTNALELGVDIGSLDACVMTGYPGTVASTWQQAGRSGRRDSNSVAILVASSSPLDQFVVNHPEYFFENTPEHGLINPDNLLIVVEHLKCAVFELPFQKGESFGGFEPGDALDYLTEIGILHQSGDTWYWMSDSYPAEAVSLRSASRNNVVIIDRSIPGQTMVIGEVDAFAAPMLVHADAIYIHDGSQYHVDRLDWEEKKAYVHSVDVDHYTSANLSTSIDILEQLSGPRQDDLKAHGEVLVSSSVTRYKKVKMYTHEIIGHGDIQLPEQKMHTTAFWMTVPEYLTARMDQRELTDSLEGLANVVGNVAPLYLMCDPRDIGVYAELRSSYTSLPTVFVYDKIPGGIGFSLFLYELHRQLLTAALELIQQCPCNAGCPSCVGVGAGDGEPLYVKKTTKMLVRALAVLVPVA